MMAAPARAASAPIPPVDLIAQYQALKAEIDQAIQRVLDRGQYILGPEGEAFEAEFAAACGARFAVGVASGTDALELALRACGIGAGDEVITSAFSFFASAGSAAALGARPVFVDIDPATYLLDLKAVERAITPRTKAVIPVHLYGHPCDMPAIRALAASAGIRVIEDCAQAAGATVGGRPVGGWGDAAAFSFYPTKNLGAFGDGGMVVTGDAELAERVRMLRMHGSRDRVRHEAVSRNSRLDELQAAILRVKLPHLGRWNEVRRAHAAAYGRRLSGLSAGVGLPQEQPGARHVYHLYVVRVRNRDRIRRALAEQGVVSQVHYELPLHLEPAFAGLGYRPGSLPHAEHAASQVLTLPIFPELASADLERVAKALETALTSA